MSKQIRIRHPDTGRNGNPALYWSNYKNDWVPLAQATVYAPHDARPNLPLGRIEVVREPKARHTRRERNRLRTILAASDSRKNKRRHRPALMQPATGPNVESTGFAGKGFTRKAGEAQVRKERDFIVTPERGFQFID